MSARAITVQEVPLKQIKGPAFSIRTETKELDLDFIQSIKNYGVKQPILLRRKKPPYEIVAGVKRFEACKQLKLKSIPAIIEDLDDKTAFELMLTENIQRRNLSPIEEANAFKIYLADYRWGSISELADKIDKSHSFVVERLSLIDWMAKLPEEIQREIVPLEQISVSHIEEVRKLKKPEHIRGVVDAVKREKLTVPQTQEVVGMIKKDDLPVEKAVETVRTLERVKEVASEVTEALKGALVEAAKEAKEIEESESKKLMENYMFLGTIIENLKAKKIFCIDHPNEEPSLEWSCRTNITKTHEKLREKLRFGT